MNTQRMSYSIWSEKGRTKIETMFLVAVEESNRNRVISCLEKGVNVNVKGDDNLAALHIAAIKGDVLIGRLLLAAPEIDMNIRTFSGITPLIYAAIYGQRQFMQELRKKGANVNLTTDKRQTALHIACCLGNLGIVADLVSSGASINITDVFDNSPLSTSVIDHPNISITRYLLKKGADATHVKEFPLFLECVLNCNSIERLNILEILLSYGVNINFVHPVTQMNCLHYVAITGYVPLAEYLLLNGASLAHQDRMGRTPLDVAKKHENFQVLKLFKRWPERKSVYFADQEEIIEDVRRLYVSHAQDRDALSLFK